MFVHLAKDFMKKLEEVDRRLETSIEKEEIQTLGLKLRFYYNEIKHYNQLLGNVFSRIREIQEKYGFLSDDGTTGDIDEAGDAFEEITGKKDADFEAAEPPPRRATAPAMGQKRHEELVGLVTDWIRNLDSQGGDVDDILLKPKRLNEIMAADAPGSKTVFSTGDEPPSREPAAENEIPHSSTVEIPLGEKTSSERNVPARNDGAEAVQGTGTGKGGDIGPELLDRRIGEWEDAIGKGEMQLVLEGVREFVQKHRQECLGVISSDSSTSPGRAESSARADFLYGLVAMLLGNYGRAINMLESALRKAGAPAETHRILADCYFQKGLYENALVNYRKSIAADVQKEESILEASECLLRLGKYEEGIGILEGHEFAERSNRLHAGIRLAETQLELKRHNEALEKARMLLEECRTHTERSFCYHLLARVKEAKSDLVGAIDLYERSLENDAMNAPARLALGKLCMNNRALPLAKNHFHFIARNFPESEWADEARLLLYNVAEMAAQDGPEAAAQT